MSRGSHTCGGGGGWWHRLARKFGLGPAPVPPTPEQEKAIGRRALAQGDLPHCAHHAAAAILADPMDPEARHLLDELILASDDPVALFPMAKDNYAGTVAARAYALNKKGQTNEAIGLVRQLIRAVRDKPFRRWGVEWLAVPGAAEKVEAVHCAGVLAGGIEAFPGLVVGDEKERQRMEPFLAAAEAAGRAHPDAAMVLAMRSTLLRKAGRIDEALELGEHAFAAERNYMTGIARAMAYQARGDTERAIAAYRDIIALAPDDADARTDLALLLAQAGRNDEALGVTEEAVAREPKHRTAEGLVLFLRGVVHGDRAAAEQFDRWLKARPGHLLEGYLKPVEPYVGYLPEPCEATINALKQLLASPSVRDLKEGGSVSLEVSHLEAPSSRLSVDRALPAKLKLEIKVGRVAEPDPRLPDGDVDVLLWKYDGMNPSPAVDPPPAAVAEKVASLASQPFQIERWWSAAEDIALELGVEAIPGVLATMVHPPPLPTQGMSWWAWILNVQVAAALIVARAGEAWNDPVGERALRSVFRGPGDWTTTAAILALTQRSLQSGDSRATIELFWDRLKKAPREGYCCYAHALVRSLLRLPALTEFERLQCEEIRQRMERS